MKRITEEAKIVVTENAANEPLMRRPAKNQAKKVIETGVVAFEHPLPDVGVALIGIANASWVKTNKGIVVIDTLENFKTGMQLANKVREEGMPVKTIIYTHGHNDHVGGARAFLDDCPEIIGQRYLPERFEKYTILAEHRARIASIQFNLPFAGAKSRKYVYPTRTYNEYMRFQLGDKTFELHHARAETDDHTWVHVPEIKTVFVGDLIIAGFPNVGNPFKPTRFALSWARALEAILAKEPEVLIAHGGRPVYRGERVKAVLEANIQAIYAIHAQVVRCLNQGMPVEEMLLHVKLPDHLQSNPYLDFLYSRPEFAVYNIYRWYHGYFDYNPAHLLPRPESEVNREIFNLICDPEAVLDRARDLADQGKTQLALQVLDILIQAKPLDKNARTLHLNLLETLCEADYCLMSRNTWVYFIEKDKEILGIS